MKNVLKLIRNFVGLVLFSSFLILLIDLAVLTSLMFKQIPSIDSSPYKIARETGKALYLTEQGDYVLSEPMLEKLDKNGAWAFLIDNDTSQMIWHTDNLPSSIPKQYSLSDIADLSIGYLLGYPTFTGANEKGLVVVGYPVKSFWKHTTPTWKYSLISDMPKIISIIIFVDIVLMLIIYLLTNLGLIKSIDPIIKGIQDLSSKKTVRIPEKGLLSEISANINLTSVILQDQQEQLRKKEKARANWIAGVSHDIRTPLSMIMGYAGQLESSTNLPKDAQKKASIIVKQSNRMKNLINDLNLASKLEYNMQPLMKKDVNIVALVRQTIVDFMNMDIDDKYHIELKSNEYITKRSINVDADLLQRAISNLIQNSINHNEEGCTIYIDIAMNRNFFTICVEDNGIGVSDEQLKKLNETPHYMICDNNIGEQRHGLGLQIVKQIMEAHQGTVAINHSEHGGFKVVLTIPSHP